MISKRTPTVKTTIVAAIGIVLATLGTVAAAQSDPQDCPVADATRQTRPLPSFNRIEIIGVAEVVLRQGKTEAATIEASSDLLSRTRTEVEDRTLYIDVSSERRWSDWTHLFAPQQTPRVTIDFVRLDQIEAGGAIKLSADGIRADELRLDFSGASTIKIRNLQASKLSLEGSGATKVELSGRVGTQAVELSGAGSYAAFDVESDRAQVTVSGAGKAYINAKTALSVEISGAGLVEYMGNPKLDKDISGVGKVRRREAD
jgi:Putative auto-transporter adhesin, head GIN domain